MKATDLRIGNYISAKGVNDLWQVTSLHSDQINARTPTAPISHTGNADADSWEPIILTEEWLKRFGFKWDQNDNTWLIRLTGHTLFSYMRIETDMSWSISDNHNNYHRGAYPAFDVIPYVHTLQNIVHSLTGSELTIKEHDTENA